MKKLILTLALISTASYAQELVIEAGGADGLCLTGFAQNAPEKICLTHRTDGKKIVSKPLPAGGCVLPWTPNAGKCVAILRVAKVPVPRP